LQSRERQAFPGETRWLGSSSPQLSRRRSAIRGEDPYNHRHASGRKHSV
jgi:hypothetical protein